MIIDSLEQFFVPSKENHITRIHVPKHLQEGFGAEYAHVYASGTHYGFIASSDLFDSSDSDPQFMLSEGICFGVAVGIYIATVILLDK